jgi:hypothetical protein
MGDWSPEQMATVTAELRQRRIESKIPIFTAWLVGVLAGLPLGKFVPPLYWIVVATTLLLALGALHIAAAKRKLAYLEANRSAENRMVDLGPEAAKMTDAEFAAHAARRINPKKAAQVLDNPERVAQALNQPRPRLQYKPENGGAA